MRFLESWVTTPLAQALGWTLLHSLWEGAIVSAVLGAALWATRSARARYAAACAAMLLMLGGIGLTLVQVMPERVHILPGVRMTALPPWNVPPDLGAAGPSGLRLAAVVPWLAPFWIAGVWIFALGQMGGWIWLSRLRRRGVCCGPEPWQKEIERLSARLRVSKPVQILESCLADVPMVVGHIRPVILMPIGLLAGLPAAQIEAILLHELAHIRRCDYLVNVMQRAAECLLFYHPAVWWISRVIRTERENCCDDVVVAISCDAQQYAAALTTLAEIRWPGGTPAVATTGGSLVKRIRRLLYPKAAKGVWTPLFAVAILLATGLLAFAAWPSERAQQSSAGPPSQQGTVRVVLSPQLKQSLAQPLVHFRMDTDSRKVFGGLAHMIGFDVAFTYDFQGRPISVDLSNVTVEDVLQAVCAQTKSFWRPLSSNTILIIPDTPKNRQRYAVAAPDDQQPYDAGGVHQPEASAYDKWLDEEVAYIITAEERAAFKKLATDEQREKFIEQFWERRNPHPGSPNNEFKEEHYRRMAYANQHFASHTTPGWKTDRGRIYIIYGPPDEIDSHPSGGIDERPKSAAGDEAVAYPFEVWRYAHFQFPHGVESLTLEFVDESFSGDYHMTLDLGKDDSELSPPGQSGLGPVHNPEEVRPRKNGESPAPRAKDRAETSPYDKWLNEEVVYIITDQERAAFLQLTDDNERAKFVEEFWERRNPHPGAPENEFKKEHYRRIAYANERFAFGAHPGWKSARGHTYILFGPPDEIDDHDAGPPYPYQEWRYKHAGGLGDNVVLTFIDPARDGSFRIAPVPPVAKDSPRP